MHAIIVVLLGALAAANAGHLAAAPVVLGAPAVVAQPAFVRSVVPAPAVVHTASVPVAVPVATSYSHSYRAPVVKAYAAPAPVVYAAGPAPIIKSHHHVVL